ncbi:hypothetical protein MASR1M31_24170 [Porphyromonadaceae bacterium]|nr:DUF3408 domain-containing protein [Dysgonomonas mossii]
MIPNPIIYNDTTITIGLIVCCLIVLAIVMIPKAIRHRKQVKQNESEKTVQDEQEVEITIISEEKMKKKEQTFDYRKTFLTAPKLEDRKPVFVSRETRDSLDKIARRLGDRKMSVSGFLENMAKHHLEEYKDEVNRLYKE